LLLERQHIGISVKKNNDIDFSSSRLKIKYTPLILVTIMVTIVSLVIVITFSTLYNASFEQQRMRLTELAKNQAGLISAIGDHEKIDTNNAFSDSFTSTTLSQIVQAHKSYKGFGQTGEFALAKKLNNKIVFLLTHRHSTTTAENDIPMTSEFAQPMQLALNGMSGTIIGLDYRGETVLAAYEPIRVMGWGVVAKIDLSEIREPFIRAAVLSILAALILIIIATALFMRFAGGVVRKLKVSEALHKGILHGAVDAIITIDERNTILSFNPAAEHIFGYSLQEIIGQKSGALITLGDSQGLERLIPDYSTTCGEFNELGKTQTLIGKHKNGDCIPIEMTSSKISLGSGYVYTWILRNVSRRKKIEDELDQHRKNLEKLVLERTKELKKAMLKLENTQSQLIQTEKLASIGQLAAGVAHEINNPVGYISSNINSLQQYMSDIFELIDKYQKLLDSHSSDEDAKSIQSYRESIDYEYLKPDILDLISESVEGVTRVKQIVHDLKDFSREGQHDWEEADLHGGIESTLNIVHNQLKYKATINKEYGEIPLIECIPAKLNQVFMNMLVNAGHAIDEQGTVTIRTGATNQVVWIEIEDDGEGIPADKLKHIFDPFYTTKPVGKGTGLGLSLSYGIVNEHNGRIEVESKAGQGTLFRISIPIHHQEAAA